MNKLPRGTSAPAISLFFLSELSARLSLRHGLDDQAAEILLEPIPGLSPERPPAIERQAADRQDAHGLRQPPDAAGEDPGEDILEKVEADGDSEARPAELGGSSAAQEEADAAAADARRSQVRTVDRSERIRTYNYPENRISDHRTGYKAYHLDQVLDGDLQPVIDSCVEADLEARLDAVEAG